MQEPSGPTRSSAKKSHARPPASLARRRLSHSSFHLRFLFSVLCASVSLWFLTVGPALADDEPQPITLAQALEMASRQNPDLLAARERAAAQTARAASVGRSVWPRLGLTTGWSRSDNAALVFAQRLNAGEFTQEDFAISRLNDPAGLSHQTTVLGVEVPLDVFGKVRAESQGQRAAARALDAGASEAALELRLRLIETYTRSALAQRALAVTEAALAGARGREADIEARVAQGAALTADLLRARSRRRQRDADLAERRADLAGALAALGRTLGAPPGARYRPQDEPGAPTPIDVDDAGWAARGLAQRPSLKAVAERLESTRWAARGAQRSQLPDLAAYAQLQDDRNQLSAGHQSTTAGVMLRWNAFDPARGKRLAAAEGDRRAAELDLRAARDQVRMEVETALRRAQAARHRYAAAAGGAEEGREALRVVQERRQAGMATLTDELETEAASLAAALEEIRAAADAAIADAVLKRVAGEL